MVSESVLEKEFLDYFHALGYAIAHGPDIAPGESLAERNSYEEVVLLNRVQNALERLNPSVPYEAIEDALQKIVRTSSPSLVENNHQLHRMLVDGVDVEYRRADGRIAGDKVRLIDFDNIDNNDFLAVNQFTVVENGINRRADIVLFVNGLPLVLIELKNPADENATIWSAFNQLQTYKMQIPSLLRFNETLIISDGLEARIGTLTADRERFMPWPTMDGETLASKTMLQSEVLVRGICDKRRLLDLIRYFIVFEENEKGQRIKKMAAYHQFHAVNKAVDETVKASNPSGNKRIGVVWHTQGSGKSLTMAFYAGKVILDQRMQNPTIVVITDRNDLDDQLFGTFSACHELLRQAPRQADSRENLKDLLKVEAGGVVFTTIHKFFPEGEARTLDMLSDRRNIVVIADEAHRSQYDFIDGFARHMRDALPNASFIGFTGTPLELEDKSTRSVFGEYISIYDIQQAVEDGATVPIYYESRLAKIDLRESERPKLDDAFEEVTEGQEIEAKEKLKTKWAALEALVGTQERIELVARDFVNHFEQRLDAMDGKAMIVCMSRRICVELYDEIVKLRPQWHSSDDNKGVIKIVMTGSASDPIEWQEHIRNKKRREEMAKKFKDPSDGFKIVIVRDMWLTGFDAPCLHTMYLDKPMHGHTLMQAIARVNRVFKDKPGGLVVDYIGLADQLRQAMATYTRSGGKGDTTVNQDVAAAIMLEKLEVCRNIFHGYDYSRWNEASEAERMRMLPGAMQHVLEQDDGKKRFLDTVAALSKAFALASTHDDARKVRDEVGFFQTVRTAINKVSGNAVEIRNADFAIRQIVSEAIASTEVIDIFAAVGLKRPDISLLSEEFLTEIRRMPQRNLAVELLSKLVRDEIKASSRTNVTEARSFAQMLKEAIAKYERRAVTTAQVIELLIQIAKDMRERQMRGEASASTRPNWRSTTPWARTTALSQS
ncbi:DEAD/DEAH box helicase [Methanomassiliicoccales archaeon RumEn M1]|nr:DEAD/DEAH box helicase [Methanomassiliicoccales archaeon RumEn M1]